LGKRGIERDGFYLLPNFVEIWQQMYLPPRKEKEKEKIMEEFAKYILNEEDLISKIEIIYFLAPKLGINFDKSIVFKTEIARMFLKYTKVKVDQNLVLTACLLCNCKKVDDAQKIGKLQTYAKEGADTSELMK
jgi:hypothetical protein